MKLYNIVFSPTGGTQKVATLLTDALKGEAIYVDLADSKQNFFIRWFYLSSFMISLIMPSQASSNRFSTFSNPSAPP